MRRRILVLCALGALLIPTTASAMLLLGNHYISVDVVGTARYFEFASFKEYAFPIQNLDWGFGNPDLDDYEYHDPSIPHESELQNRNLINMRFQANLDLGIRFRSALGTRLGLETYLKYSPADLVIDFNGNSLPAASFTRYAGVTNPGDENEFLNWIEGDYPSYHIFRYGLNLDYVYHRSAMNAVNAYVSAGAGMISYYRSGRFLVPVNWDPLEQDWPTAPEDATWYLPHDTFPTMTLGTGAIFFVHRYFGLNLHFNANYTEFEMTRMGLGSEGHWVMNASIGYTIRL